MKKTIIVIVLALLCLTSFAQTYRYRASNLAIGSRNYYGNIVWGNWERCRVIITINVDDDYIKVYSDKEQNYVIIEVNDSYKDSNGSNMDFIAIDEEGIECKLRLRVQNDGTMQFYSFYSNIAWVYSGLERI